MEKNIESIGPLNGGAVIIDDGPGKIGELVARGTDDKNLRLLSMVRLEGLVKYRKDKLKKKPLSLTIEAAGEEISFMADRVVSFSVRTELEAFSCLLDGDTVVIKASDACTETRNGQDYIYVLPDSGQIKGIEVSLKVGSFVYEGRARLTLEHK